MRKFSISAALFGLMLMSGALSGCQSHKAQQGTAQTGEEGDLKTVTMPNGAQYVYGTLSGFTNKSDAMVYMLKQTHGHFGDKPDLGKLIQSKDGHSLAVFFTLTAKNFKNVPTAGLVIVNDVPTQIAKGSYRAAVLYDWVKEFPESEPKMMQGLNEAWGISVMGNGGGGGGNASAAPAPSRGPAQLRFVTAGDRSAGVALPEGWRLTSVAGGSVAFEGPNGEAGSLGSLFQGIADPRWPSARGGVGVQFVCPLQNDLFSSYVCLVNQSRQKRHLSQGHFTLTSSKVLPSQGGAAPPPMEISFKVDYNDGHGQRTGTGRLDPSYVRGMPTWGLFVSVSNLPDSVYASEKPTLDAICRSYSQDRSVISREQGQVMAGIQAAGERSRINAQESDQRLKNFDQQYEQSRQAFNTQNSTQDSHDDYLAWSSKINQNYILDQEVVKDIPSNGTATVGDKFGDSLVKHFPNEFEVVPNQQMVRGRDF